MNVDGVLTMVHAVIASVALGTGLVTSARLAAHRAGGVWSRLFFVFAFLTDVSAFSLGLEDVRPTHVAAIASFLLLGVTLRGYYVGHQHGTWRAIYRVGVISGTYLLALMASLQLFAVTGVGPMLVRTPVLFMSAQGLLAVVSLIACIRSLRFRPGRRRRAAIRPLEFRP